VLAGCSQEEPIQQFTVSHEERESIRLRVAIFPRKDWVWFVRLSGPEKQVNEQSASFEQFVKSIRFDVPKSSTPINWDEPKGWKKDASTTERYAGFRIDAKPRQLEVTVTRLPADKYKLIDNMHRWQKQINVPLSESMDDTKAYVTPDVVGEQAMSWVDMKGLGIHAISKPPSPVVGGKNKLPGGLLGRGKVEVPFKYTVPKDAGWMEKEAPEDGITSVFIDVSEGDQHAKVTFTALPRRGDVGLAANIRRWRGQLQLPDRDIPKAELEKSAVSMPLLGVQASYVDLENPQGVPHMNRILAVLLPLREHTWVIRMSGPSNWVGQNKNAFETFVKSFRLDVQQ
jgi:hypothetical protein